MRYFGIYKVYDFDYDSVRIVVFWKGLFMDFQENDNQQYIPEQPAQPQTPPAAPPPQVIQVMPVPPKKKFSIWRVFFRILFAFSILANILMFFILIAMASILATGQAGIYNENEIKEGSQMNKIVVIRLEGLITGQTSREFRKQIKIARDDDNVKALIIRTNSPGGYVSASDQIHHEIRRFRTETGKPVVAFMQSVAASGGYYTSVACDEIIAEPTVITGSIGVIMSHLVVQQLLEEKLGINPVVIKSGEKKDWPSPFSETTEEQVAYLRDKLIDPTYNRFVDLVIEGREESLTAEEVKTLADGSIYTAKEAMEVKLIDRVGYIEDAIIMAETLAGITDAMVVEYNKPFSFSSVFGIAQTSLPFTLDENTIHKMLTPKLMYLWKPAW